MGKPSTRVHRPGGIQGIEKTIALQAVSGYCTENGLSMDKLSQLMYEVIYDTAVFLAPTGVEPNGLVNDIATQPVPVLIMEGKGNNLQIRQTEHTSNYIAM